MHNDGFQVRRDKLQKVSIIWRWSVAAAFLLLGVLLIVERDSECCLSQRTGTRQRSLRCRLTEVRSNCLEFPLLHYGVLVSATWDALIMATSGG